MSSVSVLLFVSLCFFLVFFPDVVTTSAPATVTPRRTTARTTTRAPAGGSCRRPTLWSAPLSCLRSDLLALVPRATWIAAGFVFFVYLFLGAFLGDCGWGQMNGLNFLQSLWQQKEELIHHCVLFRFVSAKLVSNRVNKWTPCCYGSDWPDALGATWRC